MDENEKGRNMLIRIAVVGGTILLMLRVLAQFVPELGEIFERVHFENPVPEESMAAILQSLF